MCEQSVQEQSQEPLSFKGQMAARYRERLSMGFGLGGKDFGEGESSRLTTALGSALEDHLEARIEGHGVPGTSERDGSLAKSAAAELFAGSSRSCLGAPRSKSSVGDADGESGKPAMKDLIRTFERRSFTATQLTRDTHDDADPARMARAAWSVNTRGIKMDLDPSAKTSSSSSDDPEPLRSVSSESKPPCAKTSKATLSLTHELGSVGSHLFSYPSSPLLAFEVEAAANFPQGEVRVESELAVNTQGGNNNVMQELSNQNQEQQPKPNSHAATDSQISSMLQAEACGSGDKDKGIVKQVESETRGTEVTSPLRVSLRGIANRRMKQDSLNNVKYLVHKKDWSKRFQAQHQRQTNTSPGIEKSEPTSKAVRPKVSDRKQDVVKLPTRPATTMPWLRQETHEKQTWQPRHELKAESQDNLTVENKSRAVERYLQFLKRSNESTASTDNRQDTDKKSEKTEMIKASRPPTPHRTHILRRGREGLKKNSAVVKESNQTVTNSTTETPTEANTTSKDNVDKESGTAVMSRFRPRSRPSLITKYKKDKGSDQAAKDQRTGQAISLTSITSSVAEELAVSRPTASKEPSTTASKPMPKWNRYTARTPTGSQGTLTPHPRPAKSETPTERPTLRPRSSLLRKRFTPSPLPRKNQHHQNSQATNKASPDSASCGTLSGGAPEQSKVPENEEKSNIFIQTAVDAGDVGVNILTEDELAENELIPPYLKERSKSAASTPGNCPLLMSSSDDSYSLSADIPASNLKASRFQKMVRSSPGDKQSSTPLKRVNNLSSPSLLLSDTYAEGGVLSRYETPVKQPADRTPLSVTPDCVIPFSVHGKYLHQHQPHIDRKINPAGATSSRQSPHALFKQTEDYKAKTKEKQGADKGKYDQNTFFQPSMQRRQQQQQHQQQQHQSVRQQREQGGVVAPTNPPSCVVPDEVACMLPLEDEVGKVSHSRHETPLPVPTPGLQPLSPILQPALPPGGHSPGDKEFTPTTPTLDQVRTVSPTSRSRRPPTAYVLRPGSGSTKERKGEKPTETQGMGDSPKDDNLSPVQIQTTPQKVMDTVIAPTHPFHFGHPEYELLEEKLTVEPKREKSAGNSPQKKRRKLDKPKKLKKKKKKKKEEGVDDEPDTASHTQSVQKLHKERKTLKDKLKEKLITRQDKAENPDKHNRSEKDKVKPADMTSVTSEKSRHIQATIKQYSDSLSPKRVSGDTSSGGFSKRHISPGSSMTSAVGPKSVSRDPSPYIQKWQVVKAEPTPISLPIVRPVSRLTCERTSRWPMKSRIPLLCKVVKPRKRLDLLIQYRRWREAILDCPHPSRIPLSDSFRKKLDSAVVEEWALHCWQPPRDIYMDSQGIWWSASCDDVQDEIDASRNLLTEGASVLSKDSLIELTARLPYVKVGPLRMLHASYLMMGVACLIIGHLGVKLYQCGGDDYEYFCPEDDIECLLQTIGAI